MNTTYVEKMKSLQKAVDAVDEIRVGGDVAAYEFWYWLQCAIWTGEQNGCDTMIENDYPADAERQAQVAYNSICQSAEFEKQAVRDWYAAQGYKW